MTILFYPEPLLPTPMARVYRICKEYGIEFHNDPQKYYDLHFFWSYTPRSIIPDEFTLTDKNVINRGCWDIGKQKVNDIFNDISINPEIHQGLCVKKSDRQGNHKGHSIIQCPVLKQEGYIYQKYIEEKEENLFINYRIYYGDNIDYIVKQYKISPFGLAVEGAYVKNEFIPIDSVLTIDQQKDIKCKCQIFGFNYGDIDFLIDNGIPVIIDLNNVAGWPYYTKEIQKVQDEQFLRFIKRRYDQSGKIL